MPGRSPHRSSPSGSTHVMRMHSPVRHRTGSHRRSRSPVKKTRSLSPPLNRDFSPKHIREESRRPSLAKRSRVESGTYETEQSQYQTTGIIPSDRDELMRLTVNIKRKLFPIDKNSPIIRAITNPEDIVIVRRHGEGERPIFMRPEIMAEGLRDRHNDKYQRIKTSRDNKKETESTSYSPTFEVSRSYYTKVGGDRAQSPGCSSSRRSPLGEEYYKKHQKTQERSSSSRPDARHDVESRHRDVSHYAEQHSAERNRVTEKHTESHHRYEDRHYEREKRHGDRSSPRERKRASTDSRKDGWERETKRKRARSRERGNGREHSSSDESVAATERRVLPYRPDPRARYRDEPEYIPMPAMHGPIPVPMRPAIPVPIMRGRPMMRGMLRPYPRIPFMRGVPPRAFMPPFGGYVPRFYPPF